MNHGPEDVTEDTVLEVEHRVANDMAECMAQFTRTFEASSRRWELIVYPSLLAFIVVASYVFFLIFSLTNDIGKIAQRMTDIQVSMESINKDFSSITTDMNIVSSNLIKMTQYVEQMNDGVKQQNATMSAIVLSMHDMNVSLDAMSYTVYHMSYDTRTMGRNFENISGPMRFMNNYVPW